MIEEGNIQLVVDMLNEEVDGNMIYVKGKNSKKELFNQEMEKLYNGSSRDILELIYLTRFARLNK